MTDDDVLTLLAEPRRMRDLAAYDLFDGDLRARLDEVCAHSARAVGATSSLVSMVLDSAQLFAGSYGLAGWLSETGGSPAEWSFCARAVLSGPDPYVVPDATADPVHRDSPLVVVEGIRAYAGVPIAGPTGAMIGAHCAVFSEPHWFTGTELRVLVAAAEEIHQVLEGSRRRNSG